jgi:hypothetical protein
MVDTRNGAPPTTAPHHAKSLVESGIRTTFGPAPAPIPAASR